MTIDWSNKCVIVDDFIGGKRGRECIGIVRSYAKFENWVPLSRDEVRNSILEDLKGKHYDTMLFFESGGADMLSSHEITEHADKQFSVPLSGHYRPSALKGLSFLDKIKNDKNIAFVEGDVGNRGYSLRRMQRVGMEIKEKNRLARIDYVIGVAASVYKRHGEIAERGIVGYFVEDFKKLSDIIREPSTDRLREEIKELQPIFREWRNRKSLPVKA